jgi:predicted  nucleic acid-binding Zn-ribbon protein
MTGRESEELVLLKQKIRVLISKFEEAQEDLQNLRSECEKVKQELKVKVMDHQNLQNEFERLKLSGAILGDSENSLEAKKRINKLVREIDGCIALLNEI